MEGNSFTTCRSLTGKMINGDNININTSSGQVNVEAIYGASTNIYANESILIGLCRGHILVSSSMMMIQ